MSSEHQNKATQEPLLPWRLHQWHIISVILRFCQVPVALMANVVAMWCSVAGGPAGQETPSRALYAKGSVGPHHPQQPGTQVTWVDRCSLHLQSDSERWLNPSCIISATQAKRDTVWWHTCSNVTQQPDPMLLHHRKDSSHTTQAYHNSTPRAHRSNHGSQHRQDTEETVCVLVWQHGSTKVHH